MCLSVIAETEVSRELNALQPFAIAPTSPVGKCQIQENQYRKENQIASIYPVCCILMLHFFVYNVLDI